MFNRPYIQSFLILFLLATNCTTANAKNESTTFTLKQLIELAQHDNKDLQAARYAINIGNARLVQAGLRSNPTLGISTRNDLLFGNEGEYGNAVGISQSFPIAGRISRQKDVARVDIALAEAEVAEAERRLVGDIASDVYRLVITDQQIASRNSLIDIQSTLTRTTRERFKAAEVSALDVNTAQLDLQRLTQERLLLESQRESLLVSLNTRIGRAPNSPLVIDEPLAKLNTLPSLSELQIKALELRPDLHSAMLNADRAQAEKSLAKALRWEDWTVGLEFSQDKQVIDGAPPQASSRAIGISVSIPLPYFNKGQGLLAEAEATHDQAMARIEAMRFGIAAEVASTHAEASRLQAALTRYDKSMLPVSASNVRLAQQGYRQGLIPIFDVVQAQRQQADLTSAYLETLDQYLQALVRMHNAVGDYLATSNVESIQ
jgi:outer membrane protein, heavy metal efflux system